MSSPNYPAPLVFIIAGETSGDLIGARLMTHLKYLLSESVRFDGIGGRRMAAEGLISRFPFTDLSLVGMTEVLPHVPKLLWRMHQTAKVIVNSRPEIVVFIDASGFSRGVARRLKRKGIPLVQYKAPQAWAYWPWRARKMAKYFDHVFTILPFEPEFFNAFGVHSTFIGHPAVESGAGKGDGIKFRARHGIPADSPVICILPGSRKSEVHWSLDEFGSVLNKLAVAVPNLNVVVPTLDPVDKMVAGAVAQWGVNTVVTNVHDERFDAFDASDVALAVSGTVTAELACSGVPMVICNRVSKLTAAIVRRIIRVKYISVPNLLLNRAAVPELIQENCRVHNITPALVELLTDSTKRSAQIDDLKVVSALLGAGDLMPTERAANILMGYLQVPD